MRHGPTALLMALAGAFFFAVFVSQDVRPNEDLSWRTLPWGLLVRYGVAMVLGGLLAGFLFGGLFGRRGVLGWLLAVIVGILALSLSGLLGSAVGLLPDLLADGYQPRDLVAVAAGVLILPLTLADQPWLLAVLLLLIGGAHVLARRGRLTR